MARNYSYYERDVDDAEDVYGNFHNARLWFYADAETGLDIQYAEDIDTGDDILLRADYARLVCERFEDEILAEAREREDAFAADMAEIRGFRYRY